VAQFKLANFTDGGDIYCVEWAEPRPGKVGLKLDFISDNLLAGGRRVYYYSPRAAVWCAYGHACRLGGLDAADDLDITYRALFARGMSSNNEALACWS
jgi:hypothetical protein